MVRTRENTQQMHKMKNLYRFYSKTEFIGWKVGEHFISGADSALYSDVSLSCCMKEKILYSPLHYVLSFSSVSSAGIISNLMVIIPLGLKKKIFHLLNNIGKLLHKVSLPLVISTIIDILQYIYKGTVRRDSLQYHVHWTRTFLLHSCNKMIPGLTSEEPTVTIR